MTGLKEEKYETTSANALSITAFTEIPNNPPAFKQSSRHGKESIVPSQLNVNDLKALAMVEGKVKVPVKTKPKANPIAKLSDKSKMAVLKDMILAGSTPEKLIQRMINVALDDDHKDSFLALRFLNERLLPMSQFEKGQANKTVQINIVNALTPTPSSNSDSVIDTELEIVDAVVTSKDTSQIEE